MVPMKHRGYIVLSGFVWFFMGVYLLFKGLHYITEAAFQTNSLCFKMSPTFGTPQQAATILLVVGLVIGFLKGRFVLVKTVRRVVARIASLPLPIQFKDAYARSYWLIIAFMMALGMTFRFLPIPIDLKGTIDVAIGSALINGAMLFFKATRSICDTDSRAQSQ